MNKLPDYCKDCVLLSKHKNHRTLTEGQKKYDNWCCAKGQPAFKAIAYCRVHNLKRENHD